MTISSGAGFPAHWPSYASPKRTRSASTPWSIPYSHRRGIKPAERHRQHEIPHHHETTQSGCESMSTEAQDIISMYQPRMYEDQWWVDIGDGLRRFKTADEARKFIADKRHAAGRCLYYGCLLTGRNMSYGVGFRFCEKHARNARHILDNPLANTTKRQARFGTA